ncbi:uncharacterized protein Trf4 isoform X2 [Drosophila suzukii]|uniref:Uncharacterized protein Trf4 isoform X2 n=1 Tax=Drosophila suzukii TaxID=28584 RepID=A0AB39ZAU5_DROSZ
MDSMINKLKDLNHLDDEEDETKADCLKDKKKPDAKLSNLDKLFNELNLNDVREDFLLKRMKVETGNSNNYLYKDYFNNSSTDIPWDKVRETGDPMGPDFEIDFENVFEDVSKLTEVENQLQLLYRPFICQMDLNCRFNMYELCLLMADSRYDPASHPTVSVKVTHPSAQVKIHAAGKIVATALNSDSARIALFKVIRVLQDLDYKPDIKNFGKSIVNASFSMPFKLDLELMSRLHSEEVTYNWSKRPFITYTDEKEGVRFAVFPTGFVLVLHSNGHSETREAISAFLPILAKFKNGYPTDAEKEGKLVGDLSYKLLWEKRLEEDKEGLLLYC